MQAPRALGRESTPVTVDDPVTSVTGVDDTNDKQ
jgi:hypothetical protein